MSMCLTQAQLGRAHRSVPLLPIECLLLIARYSEPGTLQKFRLVSKAFQRLADPILWKGVRLVPNIDCLQSFLALVRTSSIASHIHTLLYDTSWQTLISEIKIQHDAAGSLGKSSSADNALLARCIDGDVKSAEASAVELCLLTQIISALPYMSSLQILMRNEPRLCHRKNLPPYYRTVCHNGGLTIRDHPTRNPMPLVLLPHVCSLLLAACSNPVKVDFVGLDDLPWSALFQESSPLLDPSCSGPPDFKYRQQVFGSLKSLRLMFRTQPSRDLDQHLRPLREVLSGCPSLVRLRIRFNEQVETRYSANYRMFSYLAPFVEGQSMRPLMPKLSELHMDSCLCTHSELLRFLIMHSSTLRVLCLSNISLLQSDGGDARGCWVLVITSLRHALRLNKVTFRGWLSNGGRQRWFVHQDRSVHPSRLRPQVENFVTRQSDFMPHMLTAVAIKPGQDDLPRPSSGLEVEGDWSWTMTYSTKSKYERLLSGYDFFSNDDRFKKALQDPSSQWEHKLGPKAVYACPALLQQPPKTKCQANSIYTHWSHPPSLGLLSLPVKNMPSGQKPQPNGNPPQPLLSLDWGPLLEGSNLVSQASPIVPTGGPPPLHMTYQSTSHSSSKSDSIHSTSSSYLPYTEDDAAIGDLSTYHSTSQQHSPSHTVPSYAPSHSSNGSGSSTLESLSASWSQPLPPIHPIDISGPGDDDGSNVFASTQPLSHSSYIHPAPMELGHVLDHAWNFTPLLSPPLPPPPLPPPPPPPNDLSTTSSDPVSSVPQSQTPKSHFNFQLHPSSVPTQDSSLSIDQAFPSAAELNAPLKQKPPKVLHHPASCPNSQMAGATKPSVAITPTAPGPQGIGDICAASMASSSFSEPDTKKKVGADLGNTQVWY